MGYVASSSSSTGIPNKPLQDGAPNLSAEYRDYLFARHGTDKLDPLPAMNDMDPLNWGRFKVKICENLHCANEVVAKLFCVLENIDLVIDINACHDDHVHRHQYPVRLRKHRRGS